MTGPGGQGEQKTGGHSRRAQLATILPRLVGPLDEATLRAIEAEVEWVRLRGGQVLFRQDEAGDSLYILLSGRLRAVRQDAGGAERVLNEVAPGETVGEMSILTGEPRSAGIHAIRDSELARLSRAACGRITTRYPQIMSAIASVLVDRLRKSEGSRSAVRPATNVAVVPVGPDGPVTAFADRLAAALARLGSVLHLSGERIDRLLGRPGAAQVAHDDPYSPQLGAWLDEQETAHRFVLYEADASASNWTRRCVRQADQILLVARASADPARGEIEEALFGPARPITTARRALVLLHPGETSLPSGTSRWLAARDVDNHYHIRCDTDADFARLARCLGGRALGLVLSGGGARGFAHIGVIRAIREAGLPIDMIGGTSMGAVIAGQFGLGWDYDQMLRGSRENFVDRKPHKEYTLPMISVVRSRRLDRLARSVCGETCIEDLWVNYYCVSCNLTTAEMVVHRRGPLWKAVRASGSLPGVFVPVIEARNLLVDGGILNNLPGDVMRAGSCGPMIVVNVGLSEDLAVDFEEFPSPWQLLWGRILPFRKSPKVPSILEVLTRTATVSSVKRTEEVEADADLCLRPPVSHYGLLEFEALDEIVEAGYRHATQRLEEARDEKWLQQIRED